MELEGDIERQKSHRQVLNTPQESDPRQVSRKDSSILFPGAQMFANFVKFSNLQKAQYVHMIRTFEPWAFLMNRKIEAGSWKCGEFNSSSVSVASSLDLGELAEYNINRGLYVLLVGDECVHTKGMRCALRHSAFLFDIRAPGLSIESLSLHEDANINEYPSRHQRDLSLARVDLCRGRRRQAKPFLTRGEPNPAILVGLDD